MLQRFWLVVHKVIRIEFDICNQLFADVRLANVYEALCGCMYCCIFLLSQRLTF